MNTRNHLLGGLLAACVSIGALGLAQAADAPPPDQTAATPAHEHGKPGMAGHDMDGHHGPMMGMAMHGEPGMPFMHALHQLGLSDEQHQKIHALFEQGHEHMEAAHQAERDNLLALNNPGDPGHAAAVAAAKTRAADRIQQWSDLQQQVYGVLTPEQQKKLPELLKDMQQHMDHEHAGGKPPSM